MNDNNTMLNFNCNDFNLNPIVNFKTIFLTYTITEYIFIISSLLTNEPLFWLII